MDDRWLSVADISEYLGVKKDTIYSGFLKELFLPTKSDAFGSLKRRRLMNGFIPVRGGQTGKKRTVNNGAAG